MHVPTSIAYKQRQWRPLRFIIIGTPSIIIWWLELKQQGSFQMDAIPCQY